MSTDIYRGHGWGKTWVGVCEDGYIYAGHGWGKTVVGMYRDGDVYKGRGCGAAPPAGVGEGRQP